MKKQADNQKIIQLTKEIEEWKNKYLRALADYQNLEKRIVETFSDKIKYAVKDFVIKILPVIDGLEKLARLNSDQVVKLVLKQFQDILRNEKVEKIEVLGKTFDPNFMECIEVVSSDKNDQVIEEIEPGYKMFDKIIRVAKVKVGKKKEDKSETLS